MMKTLAIAGCGKLGNIVANALKDKLLPEYRLIGSYSRSFSSAQATAELFPEECKACRTIGELLALEPDYIVEAASPAAMRELAIPALERGISIITLSIGAFADDAFYESVKQAATKGEGLCRLRRDRRLRRAAHRNADGRREGRVLQ